MPMIYLHAFFRDTTGKPFISAELPFSQDKLHQYQLIVNRANGVELINFKESINFYPAFVLRQFKAGSSTPIND